MSQSRRPVHPGPTATERRDARKVPGGYDASRFERPSVTGDVVIFSPRDGRLHVLLIQRDRPPYAGFWATPGGFVDMDEDLPVAAARELEEETGVTGIDVVQLGAYGKPDRDPRTRIISVVWYALVPRDRLDAAPPQAADDARAVGWFPTSRRGRPEMAFDHDTILDDALAAVRRRVLHTALASPLLPATFAFRQLRELYEVLLGRKLDGRRLQRDLTARDVIRRTGSQRPARYRFNPKATW